MKFSVPAPKPSAKTPAQQPGVEPGDHVYVRHPKRGPIAVKVASVGKDGLQGDCDMGARHGVPWGDVLGHKARLLHRYTMVDQGADGAILADPKGKRRYLEGQASGTEPIEETPKETGGDDPILGRADLIDMRKAMLPDDACVLFVKAGALANRPGLSLEDKTDKGGRQTKRWVRTMKDQPKERPGAKDTDAKPEMHHGDLVGFKHGDVHGEGKIVSSGADGATIQDADGREHQVRHEHLVGPVATADSGNGERADAKSGDAEAPADGADKRGGGGDGDGDGGEPPDKFSASDFAARHNDPGVTAADILKLFPTDTAGKIKDVNDKLEKMPQTIDTFKKDGKYTPERAAVHDKIMAHFLSAERIAAATPAEGTPPTFTILGGRGGSGKGWFKGKVYDPKSAVVVDADEIKGMLPEYKGWNAAQVHEESGDLFDRITESAQARGLNVVHDATMKTGPKAVAVVKGFKDAGYRAEAHYMYLPPQEAAKRGVERFLGPTKRFVPPGVILGNTTNEKSFDDVKELVDAWSFRDNNVAKGEEPKMISEQNGNGTDTGKSGRNGQSAARPGDGDRGTGVAEGSGEEEVGDEGSVRKAARFESGGVALFFKAQVKGADTGDMFQDKVDVAGHTRGGVYVAPYTAVRHKRVDLPQSVDGRVRVAVGNLHAAHQEITAARHEDALLGEPHYEREAREKHGPGIASAHVTLDKFRSLAADKGIDPEETIISHGGVPDIEATGPIAPSAPEPSPYHVPVEETLGLKTAKHFYVSAIDGRKRHLVAGPYGSHDDALARVEDVRKHADTDPRAHFMAWGTAGSDEPRKTPLGENWKPAGLMAKAAQLLFIRRRAGKLEWDTAANEFRVPDEEAALPEVTDPPVTPSTMEP